MIHKSTTLIPVLFISLISQAACGQFSLDPDPPAGEPGNPPAPVFRGVTTVRAYAEGDAAKVMTIAAADFNRSSRTDIVTVQTDGMLNLLLNDGAGKLRYASSNSSAKGLQPNVTSIQASDLNGDQAPDVVATDTNNSAVLIFLNNGDGSFRDAVSIAVSAAPAKLGALRVADLNGDTKLDLITVSRSGDAASTTLSQRTLLGNGDGTFTMQDALDSPLSGSYFIPPGSSVSVADLNKDAKPDVVLQLEQSNPSAAIALGVSIGSGDGTFQPFTIGASVNAGPQPAASLVLGDVNSDELPDALFLSFRNEVYVAFGQQDGTFSNPSAILSKMSGAVLLALGDLTNDGVLDLVVHGTGQLGVFTGNGDGTFRSAAQHVSGYGIAQQTAPIDFDGDGNADIAALDYTNGRVAVYSGKGDGTLNAAMPVLPAAASTDKWAGNVQVITSGDLNGDGNQDVLAYDWAHASAGGRADIYSGINDGAGAFTFRRSLPEGRQQQLAEIYGSFVVDTNAADFNGDRRADILLRTQSGLSVLLSNRDGTLNPNPIDVSFPVPVGCMPFNYLTTGDVNGDGSIDIIASHMRNANCGTGASTPSGIFLLIGEGTGRFNARFTPLNDAPFFLRAADLNGDSRLDLVIAYLIPNRGFTVAAVPGLGNGTFNFNAARPVVSGQFITDIVIADYNGDGRADLVLPTAGTPTSQGTPEQGTEGVILLPARGDFTYGESVRALDNVSSISNGAAATDLDGDGDIDLVFAVYAKSEPYSEDFGLVVLRNEGGTFSAPSSELLPLATTGRNTAVFVADFNKDGAPDVLAGSGLSSPLFLNANSRQQ